MANPRKFSDKLEIIRRKEEEANAAFVKIMREVSDARKTTGPPHLPPQNNWVRGPNEVRMLFILFEFIFLSLCCQFM